MFNAYQSVKVSNKEHPRADQVGVVIGFSPKQPDTVVVRFDPDHDVEVVDKADLQAL